MSGFLFDQYEEYRLDYEAWGREFFDKPLTSDEYELLAVELEDIGIAEECGHITGRQRRRGEEIERLLLMHKSYFADGPRVYITMQDED